MRHLALGSLSVFGLLVGLAVGCQPATPCNTAADCPTSFECVENACLAQTADGGHQDGGLPDAGDGGFVDGGLVDGGLVDGGFGDGGPLDAGMSDGGVDGGSGDAGPLDAGEPDAGPPPLDCGDGTRDATEDCDDGNTESGDGCSRQCTEEPGFRCQNRNMVPDLCMRYLEVSSQFVVNTDRAPPQTVPSYTDARGHTVRLGAGVGYRLRDASSAGASGPVTLTINHAAAHPLGIELGEPVLFYVAQALGQVRHAAGAMVIARLDALTSVNRTVNGAPMPLHSGTFTIFPGYGTEPALRQALSDPAGEAVVYVQRIPSYLTLRIQREATLTALPIACTRADTLDLCLGPVGTGVLPITAGQLLHVNGHVNADQLGFAARADAVPYAGVPSGLLALGVGENGALPELGAGEKLDPAPGGDGAFGAGVLDGSWISGAAGGVSPEGVCAPRAAGGAAGARAGGGGAGGCRAQSGPDTIPLSGAGGGRAVEHGVLEELLFVPAADAPMWSAALGHASTYGGGGGGAGGPVTRGATHVPRGGGTLGGRGCLDNACENRAGDGESGAAGERGGGIVVIFTPSMMVGPNGRITARGGVGGVGGRGGNAPAGGSGGGGGAGGHGAGGGSIVLAASSTQSTNAGVYLSVAGGAGGTGGLGGLAGNVSSTLSPAAGGTRDTPPEAGALQPGAPNAGGGGGGGFAGHDGRVVTRCSTCPLDSAADVPVETAP